MVKRIIGLPGENIEIIKDKVCINDKELKQFFLGEDDNRMIAKDPKNIKSILISSVSFFSDERK